MSVDRSDIHTLNTNLMRVNRNDRSGIAPYVETSAYLTRDTSTDYDVARLREAFADNRRVECLDWFADTFNEALALRDAADDMLLYDVVSNPKQSALVCGRTARDAATATVALYAVGLIPLEIRTVACLPADAVDEFNRELLADFGVTLLYTSNAADREYYHIPTEALGKIRTDRVSSQTYISNTRILKPSSAVSISSTRVSRRLLNAMWQWRYNDVIASLRLDGAADIIGGYFTELPNTNKQFNALYSQLSYGMIEAKASNVGSIDYPAWICGEGALPVIFMEPQEGKIYSDQIEDEGVWERAAVALIWDYTLLEHCYQEMYCRDNTADRAASIPSWSYSDKSLTSTLRMFISSKRICDENYLLCNPYDERSIKELLKFGETLGVNDKIATWREGVKIEDVLPSISPDDGSGYACLDDFICNYWMGAGHRSEVPRNYVLSSKELMRDPTRFI